MRTYGTCWGAAVALAAVPALYVGGVALGWLALLGTSCMLAVLGAVVSLGWTDGELRWRVVWRSAALFGLLDILLLGLPASMGVWGLLVLALLVATCPPVVASAARTYRQWCPSPTPSDVQHLSDRDLQRRWHCTADDLRRTSVDPAAALRLVQERELLLAEIERRDPELFARRLARSGWGSVSPRVE
jgi:hypothetical protein